MGLLKITIFVAFCLSTCLATYGPHYHQKGGHGGGGNGGGGAQKILLDNANIHLDSPKILVDRPRIHIKDNHSPVIDEEPIILEHDRPLYIRKSILGVHSSPRAVAPIIINGGHGGYGSAHGGYESGHGGKVLNVAGPVVVAPSPIVHDGPILVRRPVAVHKELVPTQDHLEKLHYDRITLGGHGGGYIGGGHGGGYIGGGHGGGYIGGGHALNHGGYIGGGHSLGHGGYLQAIPVAKGLQEKTVVYERAPAAPLTSLGHGLISFSAYHQPAPVFVGQPRAILGGIHGGNGHIHGGGIIAERGIYGGGIALGKDIHGGIHGGDGGYKKY